MYRILELVFTFVLGLGFVLTANPSFATVYYVNDNSLTGDVFCTAVGNNFNSGTSPSSPKATLTSVWSTYGASMVSGDIIKIDAGTYTTDIGLTINKPGITFEGAGFSLTVFDNNLSGSNTNYFMYLTASNITIKNMTIREYENNGTQTAAGHSGQAITIGGTGTAISGILLDNVGLIENGQSGGNPSISVLSKSTVVINAGGSFCNTAGTVYTGGVEAFGTNINLTIKNSVLASNYKDGGFDGGALRVDGDATTIVTVSNCRIENNLATDGGGISQINGNVTVSDCIFYNNKAGLVGNTIYGGGFRISAGTARITRSKFQSNTKSSGTLRGGAVAARYISSGAFSSLKTINLTIDSTVFQSNSADLGNDIYAANGFSNACNVTIRDCQFLTAGNYNVVSDGTSPATSISITYFGTAPSFSGSNVTRSLSSNTIYTSNPSPPSFVGVCGSAITILPIELLSFQANCIAEKIELTWETATERNNSHFSIYKQMSTSSNELVAQITSVGNATDLNSYTFTDPNPVNEIVTYTLEQTDFDGVTKIVAAVSSVPCSPTSNPVAVFQPDLNSIAFYGLDQKDLCQIKLYDCNGKIISDNTFLGCPAFIPIENKLNTGIYFVHVISSGTVTSMKVLVKYS